MRVIETGEEALRSLFTALVEQTFQTDLAIADPSLTDYLAEMLCRFVRYEAIYRVRDLNGRPVAEVAEMLVEAEARQAKPRREVYRHIGDFTLFWSGVYPEALGKLQAAHSKDHLLDYCTQGKRSYLLASEFDDEPFKKEAPILRRLSDEFELCGIGLNRVRKEWERMGVRKPGPGWDPSQN